MKYLTLGLALVSLSVGPSIHVPAMCQGAQLAVVMEAAAKLQESKLPKDQWCQRPAPGMSNKAHLCFCHQADCTDPDPDHLPAHTDPQCKKYCDVSGCRCTTMDCR